MVVGIKMSGFLAVLSLWGVIFMVSYSISFYCYVFRDFWDCCFGMNRLDCSVVCRRLSLRMRNSSRRT